ncbi:MAG TPA: hypothetical protein VHQ90_20425 [Thermoanaerobaculia bacterium]|nr:hypothetical protein [Thermoanaerobaculia bacterium]
MPALKDSTTARTLTARATLRPDATSAAQPARRGAAAVAALVFALGWIFGEFRTRTGWDDTYYLLQVSSLVEDGDLDLRNDALYSALPPRELQTFLTATLPSGSLKNTFSIGPAVLWLPAYVVTMPWRGGAGAAGPVRWSRAQLAALHLLSLAFLSGVAWFLYCLLEIAGADQRLALLATLAILIGTPLAVYGPAVYTMAHLPSAVATCLFMASVLWLSRDLQPYRALLAGAALGMVFLVRWQDAVFALLLWVPLAPLLGKRRELTRLALLLAALATGCLAVASLQLHAWHLEHGSWLTVPQGEQYMRWAQPHLRELLLSGYSGLLPWSPIFALAAAGLLVPWRCRLPSSWRIVALIVLVAEIYINAAVRDWWGGYSFGARRMSSCAPLLALGLANFGAVAASTARRRLLVVLLAALCLWGCFVTNLYWRQVHDLSLVLRGSPSLGAQEAPREGGVLTDAALARRQALRPALSRVHNYFAGVPGVRRSLGVALTMALMGGVVAASCLVSSRLRGSLLLPAVLLAFLGITLWCHVRLAWGPRPDRVERAVWQRLAEQWNGPRHQLTPATAQAAGAEAQLLQQGAGATWRAATADAYRFLEMLASWEGGEPRRARRLLDGLAAKDYPAATALRHQVDVQAPGAEVLRLLPSTFFEPRPGDASRAIALPPAGTGAVARRWEVLFDLRLAGMEDGLTYDVVALQDGNRAELACVSLRGGGSVLLALPNGSTEAKLDLAGGLVYRVRLDYDARAGTVSLVMTGKGVSPAHLGAPLAAGGEVPACLLFGRNRHRPRSFPLWSSAFSDLWVIASPVAPDQP